MKPSIQVFWNGVEIPGSQRKTAADYFIVDDETGLFLVDRPFESKQEAEAYLEQHRHELSLPPLDPEMLEQFGQVIPKMEQRLEQRTIAGDEARQAAQFLFRLSRQVRDQTLRERAEAVVARLKAAAT